MGASLHRSQRSRFPLRRPRPRHPLCKIVIRTETRILTTFSDIDGVRRAVQDVGKAMILRRLGCHARSASTPWRYTMAMVRTLRLERGGLRSRLLPAEWYTAWRASAAWRFRTPRKIHDHIARDRPVSHVWIGRIETVIHLTAKSEGIRPRALCSMRPTLLRSASGPGGNLGVLQRRLSC